MPEMWAGSKGDTMNCFVRGAIWLTCFLKVGGDSALARFSSAKARFRVIRYS